MVQDPTKIGIFSSLDRARESKPNEAEKRNDPYLPT